VLRKIAKGRPTAFDAAQQRAEVADIVIRPSSRRETLGREDRPDYPIIRAIISNFEVTRTRTIIPKKT